MNKPDRVRIVLEVYDSRKRGYREIRAIPGVPIKNQREMTRLWKDVSEAVESRDWTDLNVARAEDADGSQL